VPDHDLVARVGERLAAVRGRIEAAGGRSDQVQVLAVTKGFGPQAVAAAWANGLVEVGENYAQELVAKAAGPWPEGLAWHYLGSVQRNKVRLLAPLVACWQGVARQAEGEAIARHRPGARVLVEVDTTGSPTRHGCPPDGVPALVDGLAGLGLDVAGLMTVAPMDPDGARRAFAVVGALADRLGLAVRSMGMTDDLEAAVAEGSTMVRIGRALFGERPARRAPDQPG
jgi:hypothetical protein